MELRNCLTRYGFQTGREKLKVWLGIKDFTEYLLLSDSEEEVAKGIIEDIEKLRTEGIDNLCFSGYGRQLSL